MIEVEVHQQLRAFLRDQGESHWPHHLTLARLVARALRLERSALIQAVPTRSYRNYRLGYLTPLLLWPEPVLLVAPLAVQQRLLTVELPRLRRWMPTPKSVHQGDRWPGPDFRGLLMTTPEVWLRDRLQFQRQRSQQSPQQFPLGIPTVIEAADDLEQWLCQQLTISLSGQDWEQLKLACPLHSDIIRETQVLLTHSLLRRPVNPYGCHLLEPPERSPLLHLFDCLDEQSMPEPWLQFQERLLGSDSLEMSNSVQSHPSTSVPTGSAVATNQNIIRPQAEQGPSSYPTDVLLWADVDRPRGQIHLHIHPSNIPHFAAPLWEQQPLVLIGEAMDPDPEAKHYRKQLGLGDLTCIKFSPDRQTSQIQLYIPESLPLPNTPRYQGALLTELRRLLTLSQSADPVHSRAHPGGDRFGRVEEEFSDFASSGPGLIVLLINDLPLKGQISSILAAEFGSRVQVEQTGSLDDNSILVSGWDFWRLNQSVLPAPRLLLMATLPFPSLENPLVAGRVAFHKARRQDWFRQYLLPQCLRDLQRAIAPLRESQGIVGLFDTRVIHRSYGQEILAALSPAARLSYLDVQLFDELDF